MSTSEPLTGSLGILGGTFNPPHVGHLALARHALLEAGLDQVLLMPSHTPPHKPIVGVDPGPEHRLAMCRLAVQGTPGVGVSPLEIERGGLSFTVDTLRAIHTADPDAALTLLLGADMALTLPAWREPQKLLELASLAVAMRDETEPDEVLAALESLAPVPGQVRFLDMPTVAVSSSMVRERLAAGEPLQGPSPPGEAPLEQLLERSVATYIAEHGLYRGASEETKR